MTIKNETDDFFEILQNQIQFLNITKESRLKVMNLINGLRDDPSVDVGGSGIVEQYDTIERDLFLKWDALESQKLEIRNFRDEISDGPEIIVSPYIEECERLIERINNYQDKLETAQFVLEFEEEQHALDNR